MVTEKIAIFNNIAVIKKSQGLKKTLG